MRILTALVTVLALAACNPHTAVDTAPIVAPEPQTPGDSVLQYLLTAAATDFLAHRPSDPGRFREVRLGHFTTPGGAALTMLCGQFLSAQEEWAHFATIKTSHYEQLLGTRPVGPCESPSVIWDKQDDLSTALQRRLDSLRQATDRVALSPASS